MATVKELQVIRCVLAILLIVNSIMMAVLIVTTGDYVLALSINLSIYLILLIAFYVTTYKLRNRLIQQLSAPGIVVPVAVVHAPNARPGQAGPPPPPPPGFVTGPSAPVAGAPPPYSQVGPWTTQQPATGYSQPPAASSQPFAAFNQPGQNAYWNPAQTK